MKSKLIFISLIVSSMIASAAWLPTESGVYVYDDEANWENGVIDGVLSTSYSGKPWFTLQMLTNRVYDLDLRVGGEPTIYIESGNIGDKTLIFDNDVEINSNYKSKIYFGSYTDNNGLNIDLNGGKRLFSNNGSAYIGFRNVISNGVFVINKGSMTLDGNKAVFSDGVVAEVKADGGLGIGTEDCSYETLKRADTINLDGGTLTFTGHKNAPASTDIVGKLVVSSSGNSQKTPIIRTQSKNYNATLLVNDFERVDKACFVIDYNNVDFGRDLDIWTCYLKIPSSTVDCIGGEKGTASASVVPWVRGKSSNMMFSYDDNLGFVPLDDATDYRIIDSAFVGSFSEFSGENIKLANGVGTVDILDEDVTINSLTGSTSAEWIYATNGVLRITSGSITLDTETKFRGNLDLGPNTGYIWYRAGKVEELHGTLDGTDIAIQPFYSQFNKSLDIYSTGLFTGDVYINGLIWCKSTTFLPFGERKGRTVVNGQIRFGTIGDFYINGLEGTGAFTLDNNYNCGLFIGDNDASAVFEGKIVRSGGDLRVTKIGNGTQVVNGEFSINKALSINSGAFITNDRVSAQSITVKNGAIYGGSSNIDNASTVFNVEENATIKPGDADGVGTMTVAGNVTMADTSKLAFTFTSVEEVSSMTVAGNVLGADANVGVTLDGNLRSGNYLLLSGASLEPNFVSNTPNVLLRKENGGTELWAYVPQEATLIVIR